MKALVLTALLATYSYDHNITTPSLSSSSASSGSQSSSSSYTSQHPTQFTPTEQLVMICFIALMVTVLALGARQRYAT